MKENLYTFILSFVTVTINPIINNQEEVWEPIYQFNPATFYACPKQEPRFPTSFIVVFYFYVQWFYMRGDFSLCWYWWNCWPSLVKFLFIIIFSMTLEKYKCTYGHQDNYTHVLLICYIKWLHIQKPNIKYLMFHINYEYPHIYIMLILYYLLFLMIWVRITLYNAHSSHSCLISIFRALIKTKCDKIPPHYECMFF